MSRKKQDTQIKLLDTPRIQINREALFEMVYSERAGIQAVAIDIETETQWTGVGTGPEDDFGLSYPAPVVTVSFAWRGPGKDAKSDENGGGSCMTAVLTGFDGFDWQTQDPEFCALLSRLFTSSKVIIAHNLVFDVRGLSRLTGDPGLVPETPWDTMVIQRLLYDQNGYSLVESAETFEIPVPKWMREIKKQRSKLHDLPEAKVAEYGAGDARLALQIYEHQQAQVQSENAFQLVTWENRAIREYARMAARGIRLNTEYAQQRLLELCASRDSLTASLLADGLDKPGSPGSRRTYIYETKHVPRPAPFQGSIFYTPGGMLSASIDVIETLVEKHPELKILANWMRVDRMIGTFTGLLEHAALDGRIHSLITVGTHTGRRSSGHPNIQNLKMVSAADDPSGDLTGVLIGDEGFTLVEIDYSNAENWIAAMLSGDDNLAQACFAEDFHSAMAEQYFGSQWHAADKNQRKLLRRMSKNITFGTAYGMGAGKLARNLEITEDKARALLYAKDRAFPQVNEAKRMAQDKATRTGHINLWTGRVVTVNPALAYTAWNYLCQGGVGEMIKRAIVLIQAVFEREHLKSRVALDMHDAIVLEVAHDEFEAALESASLVMQSVIPDDLNQRTTPPIQWIARPDLEENKKKWGKDQAHPGYSEVSDTSEYLEPVITPAEQGKPHTKRVTLSYPDMDFQFTLSVIDDRVTEASAIAYREALITTCQGILAGPYLIRVPGRETQVQVNLENYLKVLRYWQAVLQANPGKEQEIGLSRLDDPVRRMTPEVLDEDIQWYARLFEVLTERIARIGRIAGITQLVAS